MFTLVPQKSGGTRRSLSPKGMASPDALRVFPEGPLLALLFQSVQMQKAPLL